MTLTLPDEPALKKFTPQELRMEMACALFIGGKIGKVTGAELAGVDFFAFQEALMERGLSNHSVEDLHAEMKAMDELETLKSIRRGLDDMEAGRTVDAKRVHERLFKR